MAKPIIGVRYSPSRFESRYRDGTYTALNPRMTDQCLRVQTALLGGGEAPRSAARHRLSWIAYICALVLTFATVWMVQP